MLSSIKEKVRRRPWGEKRNWFASGSYAKSLGIRCND